GPTGHLDLIDDEGIDALGADRTRRVAKEHLGALGEALDRHPQGGPPLEPTHFLVARANRTEGEVFSTDLAKLQPRSADRLFEIGDLEANHFVAARLQPSTQSREWVVVPRGSEIQDTNATHELFLSTESISGTSSGDGENRFRCTVRLLVFLW